MTLSNFDWTDKQSLRWFLLLPTGHEGPYSLETLNKRFSHQKIAADVNVWAEGLDDPLPLLSALKLATGLEMDGPPPLPAISEDEIPPLPGIPASRVETEIPVKASPKKWQILLLGSSLIAGMTLFLIYQWVKDQEKFVIPRYPKMSVEVHSRIMETMQFQGWDQPIFFKEFASVDLTHLWLVNSGYQACQVEAQFTSLKDKLLTFKEVSVKFKAKSELKNHVVELNRFEFLEGTKIIPGLYEMNVRAYDCHWDGWVAKIGNELNSPQASYEAATKVVLFEKGALEFNKLLDELNTKKMEKQTREKGQQDLFWDDLQQKFQTLQAVTLQIEQTLLNFVDQPAGDFSMRLKVMVANYTRHYGHFLTNFVVANEKYFQEVSQGEMRPLTLGKNYEEMVRMTSKKIGLSGMTIIEEMQKLKNPDDARLKRLHSRILKEFTTLKDLINARLIEVTEDRSQKP